MDWAVFVPTYQCKDAVLISSELVDTETVASDVTVFYGWTREIQNLRLAAE